MNSLCSIQSSFAHIVSLHQRYTYSVVLNPSGTVQMYNISFNGQSIIFVTTTGITWISTNYGASFTNTTTLTTNNFGFSNAVICNSGQYAICWDGNDSGSAAIQLTSNTGTTWTRPSSLSGISTMQGASLSSSGQYQVITGGGAGIYVSSDYGSTFSQTSTQTAYTVDMSESGQYILTGVGAQAPFLSTNYGVSFAQVTMTGISSLHARPVSISATGAFMLISSTGPNNVIISQDYGSTWNVIGDSTFITGGNGSGGFSMNAATKVAVFNTDGSACFWLVSDALYTSTNQMSTQAALTISGVTPNANYLFVSRDAKYLLVHTSSGLVLITDTTL